MANYDPDNRYRRPITEPADIMAVRSLFSQARDQGMSTEDATLFANQYQAPEPAIPPAAPVDLSIPDNQRRLDQPIPENWKELNWPELRNLASRIKGKMVQSRGEAETVILQAIQGK